MDGGMSQAGMIVDGDQKTFMQDVIEATQAGHVKGGIMPGAKDARRWRATGWYGGRSRSR